MVVVGERNRRVAFFVRDLRRTAEKGAMPPVHPVKHPQRNHRPIHTSSPYKCTFSTALPSLTAPMPRNSPQ